MDLENKMAQMNAVATVCNTALQRMGFGLTDFGSMQAGLNNVFDLLTFFSQELPEYVTGMEKTVADQETRIKQLEEENDVLEDENERFRILQEARESAEVGGIDKEAVIQLLQDFSPSDRYRIMKQACEMVDEKERAQKETEPTTEITPEPEPEPQPERIKVEHLKPASMLPHVPPVKKKRKR